VRLFALIVGNNHADDPSVGDLKFADDDALALHRLLLEAGARSILLARLDADSTALHPAEARGDAPSPAAFDSSWAQLQRELEAVVGRGERAEFLFFYSGHGDVSEGEGFLALEGGRLTRSMLNGRLSTSAATRNHVIIDACKSYFAVMGKGPGGVRVPFVGHFADGAPLPPRTGFLLSTSSDGESHEWERYQAGIFSFEVRSGLRGSADANGDGRITYAEIGGFLTRANAGIANVRFRPDFLVVAPGGGTEGLEDSLVQWAEGTTSLVLDGNPGHLYVEGAQGERVLEINPSPGQVFALRLPTDRPLFIRTAGGTEERVMQTTAGAILSSLPRSPSTVSSKGALNLAFAQLFSAPFDAGAVQAFALGYVARQETPPREVIAATRLRQASPFVAGGAVLVGLVATGVAIERGQVTAQTSQLERVGRNQGIVAANVTIGAAGGLAAAALASWAILSWSNPDAGPRVAVAPGPGGAVVVVSGRW
jgi:hypothetical protein